MKPDPQCGHLERKGFLKLVFIANLIGLRSICRCGTFADVVQLDSGWAGERRMMYFQGRFGKRRKLILTVSRTIQQIGILPETKWKEQAMTLTHSVSASLRAGAKV